VAAIKRIGKLFYWIIIILMISLSFGQQAATGANTNYVKRVLDNIEIDFLTSYYTQDGDNAAVSGGIGTEELSDFSPTIIISIPLNNDDILKIDVGISAYTSASSSNINPFDKGNASPFQASSGASKSDVWSNVTGTYTHNSADRNSIYSTKLSISSEYDYFSFGFGGSITKLFNNKNTELGASSNLFIDKWNTVYPYELRPFSQGGDGIQDTLFTQNIITGNSDYQPSFTKFDETLRKSFSFGIQYSQILSTKAQAFLSFEMTEQWGLLSTPFHRVYFSDIDNSFIENFQLADDVEHHPDSRNKGAVSCRLNYYLNETFILRTFYRFYYDNWGISSNTATIEIPIKLFDNFTFYPSYRYYNQTAADHFAPFDQHLSTDQYYTSDYDLSEFNSNQYGFGVKYTDIFTQVRIWKFGLKSINVRYSNYERNSGFKSGIFSCGASFVMD